VRVRNLQEVKQGRRDRIRTLHRKVVPSALDIPPGDEIGELRLVSRRFVRGSSKAAVHPSQDDGRHRDRGAFRQLALDFKKSILTRCISMTVPIRM